MLPNLPLDVDGKLIRVGDKVVFGADNGSYLHVGKVDKITPCFVWMKLPYPFHERSWRREFRRVAVIQTGEYND
jgi:hypothetical protein